MAIYSPGSGAKPSRIVIFNYLARRQPAYALVIWAAVAEGSPRGSARGVWQATGSLSDPLQFREGCPKDRPERNGERASQSPFRSPSPVPLPQFLLLKAAATLLQWEGLAKRHQPRSRHSKRYLLEANRSPPGWPGHLSSLFSLLGGSQVGGIADACRDGRRYFALGMMEPEIRLRWIEGRIRQGRRWGGGSREQAEKARGSFFDRRFSREFFGKKPTLALPLNVRMRRSPLQPKEPPAVHQL